MEFLGDSTNDFQTNYLLFDCRAYKTIVEDDLKFPLIYGEGKKVRNGTEAHV